MIRFFQNIINIIVSLFTSTSYKIGTKIFEEPRPWKLSCLTNTKFGLFEGTYNGESRRDSRLYLNGKLIYSGNDETIGQGLEFGNIIYFAGENGNLLIYNNNIITRGVRLAFASCCVEFNGKLYVFNSIQNQGINVINCLTNVTEFKMPGSGIVTQALVDGGKLYSAASDGAGGIACNDGTMIPLPNCQCIISFANSIYCSSGNKVMEKIGNTVKEVKILDCEKIMGMNVNKDLLWVAGSNPDALWVFDRRMRCKQIGKLEGSVPVGGSVFRSHVTNEYFGRCADGNRAEVYKID